MGKNPDELIQLKMDGLKCIGTNNEFQAENLLETYLATANLTIDMKVSVRTTVMSFYGKNRRRLEPDVAENIERGEPKKRCPKMEDILELENAMTTQRDKALLWFIASAPIRLGTVPKLKWKDLVATNDKDVPYYMTIEGARLKGAGKGKYKGVKQIGFLHTLSVEKLEAYKLEAKRKGYHLTDNSPIFISYRQKGEVKAYSPFTIEGMFNEASLTAWHDLDSNRFSAHDFRDFVQSALENAGININIIKPLLAHKPKGSDFNYSVHEVLEFLVKFKTALPYLLPQTIEITRHQSEISDIVTKQKQDNDKLENKNAELAKTVKFLSQTLQPFVENIDKFTEVFKHINEEKQAKAIAENREAGQSEKERQAEILDQEKKTKKK